jgi:alanine racemase
MKPDPGKDIRFAWAEIDLSALVSNLKLMKSQCARPGVKIMAVVKADAYGHGILETSRTLLESGADALGVALAEEGLLLRQEGIDAPIYILGECPVSAAQDAIVNRLILAVNSVESASIYSKLARKKGQKVSVNINIDTGMNRLGINWKDAGKISVIRSLSNLTIDGIFSHFACASEEDPGFTMLQMERFSKALEALQSLGLATSNIHFANSAAFYRFRKSHFDMVRAGLCLYGMNPYAKGCEKWLPRETIRVVSRLKPVLSLKSRISFIKTVSAGEPISYCGTFKAEKDSVIATIPVGYADGYSRILSNKSKVLIKGFEAPAVGNITMDQFMVDITGIYRKKNVKAGDEAVLIGRSGRNSISADDIAGLLGTINYEVTCMIRRRIPRIYIK